MCYAAVARKIEPADEVFWTHDVSEDSRPLRDEILFYNIKGERRPNIAPKPNRVPITPLMSPRAAEAAPKAAVAAPKAGVCLSAH